MAEVRIGSQTADSGAICVVNAGVINRATQGVYTAPTAHFARYFCPLVPLLPTDVPKMLKK